MTTILYVLAACLASITLFFAGIGVYVIVYNLCTTSNDDW
jgi:hypothetical protein